MNEPLINILIRLSAGREAVFLRCINSINNQTYRNIKVFISADCDIEPYRECINALDFDPVIIQVTADAQKGKWFYNDYCNDLKAQVSDGWFFFLDSDDYLATNDALENITFYLRSNVWQAVICQMSRDNGCVKPSDEQIGTRRILSGHIGLPCLILRAHYNNVLPIGVDENSDYKWIKSLTESLATKYLAKIVVHSPKRSFGQ